MRADPPSLDDQYRGSGKLAARINLHRKYGAGGGIASLIDQISMPAGARVLDIGCGPGSFWRDAPAHLPLDLQITLADRSPGMVTEALQAFRAQGRWSDFTGKVADVCALPFADGAFDAVLAMHMLYHAEDVPRAVREISRVLAPEGVLFASTNSEASLAALFELGHSLLGGEWTDSAAQNFSLETGDVILCRAFDNVEMLRAADVLRVTDASDVVAYLASTVSDDHMTDALRAELKGGVDAEFRASGGVFEIARDTGVFIARGKPREALASRQQ